ncbi:short-chain fatty acyl-CoA regulator family protein [Rhizobium sp. S95]|uniref:Short-chain fatty acyl-CoA regulator family protein n=1 Tax=Ciceribacter sichuanensis TaxID=2949647 RepID=A0AAJ1BTV8_9HYPH|nr:MULTISPECIES: XRE family transcriptional regulator [unclassified Ciceribacter]MCM2394752.1 short-chain fatty acyl-CoA regulator family protein [Ciceribacter sp. S95]MCM2403134.1 short-chain fatty acyl-CoA regulator family protein [Ciceribacter sp. S153]MCO5955173.1 short-chain fatty acyl-CoA regulator family protein [Ciceribacter sp. S101]
MAENKIFAGPRVRRIRNGLGLTQTAMAEALDISPSYLNLIERNQRPLTVQLLLKLAAVYKVDLDELQGEAGGTAGQLREVFADPLLSGEVPGDQELIEVAEAAPNAAAGIVKLYRAYREQAARLTDLAELLAREGHETSISGTRLPVDEVREKLERRANFYARIEDAAEAFHASLGLSPGDDLGAALKAWLRTQHGIVVRTLPIHTMPNLRRRYDRHSMRLFLSERLSPFDQLREVAMEASLLALGDEIAAELEALAFSNGEARRLGRFELARYAAHAVTMPYGAFLSAAQRARYDIDILRSRFNVSYEQAANRLTMLQRPGATGVPFFMLEVDTAGHRFRKAGAQGYPQAKFGGGCPKLNIHAAFAQPGQVLVDAVEMPDGTGFLTISRTLEGPQAGFSERVRRTALLVGCDIAHREDIVYGQAIASTPPVAVGTACRLCERQGCLARAEPPVTRPLGLDEMVTGLSAFDFQ